MCSVGGALLEFGTLVRVIVCPPLPSRKVSGEVKQSSVTIRERGSVNAEAASGQSKPQP